jgi:hypothetical protein
VAALEHTIRARSRQRARRRIAVVVTLTTTFSAAAALLLAVGMGPHAPATTAARHVPASLTATAGPVAGGDAVLQRAGATVALVAPASVRAGDRVRAGRTAVAVSLSTGTQLRLPAASALELVELGEIQRFVLRDGSVRADVAKLSPGQRFIVGTPDAEVEVRGTSFQVSVVPQPACPGGEATRVRVFEGVVSVRSAGAQVPVPAGTNWQPACDVEVPPPPPLAEPTLTPAHARRRLAPAAPVPPSEQPAPAPSTLAEQNRLFAAALLARRGGDSAEARRRLDELLTRFPTGPLAESARAERRNLAPAEREPER